MLTLAGDEGEPETIDPAHLPAWKALLRPNAASSLPMKRSKPRFAASINEASIYAACGTKTLSLQPPYATALSFSP